MLDTSVSDLKGKKVAVAELTPSHSFLIWLLEAAGMKPSGIEIVKQPSAIDAAQVFKSQQGIVPEEKLLAIEKFIKQ